MAARPRPGGLGRGRGVRGAVPLLERAGITAASGAGGLKTMAGALHLPSGLVAELDSSLSRLDAGGRRVPPLPPAEQRQGAAENADLLPMVFLCAGCKRPVGDTLSWVTNDEESGCILLRSESCARQPPPGPGPGPAARGGRRSPPSLPFPPPPSLCAGAAASVSVDEERKVSKLPGECGW